MQTKIHEIHSLFLETTTKSCDLFKSNSQHIFFALLKNMEVELTQDEKMAMHHRYYSTEKALDYSRSGSLNHAKFWIEYTEQSKFPFSNATQPIMDILFYPMLAYYNYVCKDYSEALLNLDISLKSNSMIENEKEKGILLAHKLELLLNVNRVLYSMKDIDKAIQFNKKLFQFVMNGTKSDVLSEDVRLMENSLQMSTHHHIINSLYFKIYSSFADNHSQRDMIINDLFSSLPTDIKEWNICPIDRLYESVSALRFYADNNMDAFLTNIELVIPSLSGIPKMIQYDLFNKLIAVLDIINYDENTNFRIKIEEYLTDTLDLEYFMRKQNSLVLSN